jgi:hypothetical protein
VKHGDFLEIIPQVFAFVGPQDAERQRKQGPQVNHRVIAAVVLAEFVDLGVAVVAGRDAVVCPGGLDLVVFQLPIGQPLLLVTGLEKAAPAAATVVVRRLGIISTKFSSPTTDLTTKRRSSAMGSP